MDSFYFARCCLRTSMSITAASAVVPSTQRLSVPPSKCHWSNFSRPGTSILPYSVKGVMRAHVEPFFNGIWDTGSNMKESMWVIAIYLRPRYLHSGFIDVPFHFHSSLSWALHFLPFVWKQAQSQRPNGASTGKEERVSLLGYRRNLNSLVFAKKAFGLESSCASVLWEVYYANTFCLDGRSIVRSCLHSASRAVFAGAVVVLVSPASDRFLPSHLRTSQREAAKDRIGEMIEFSLALEAPLARKIFASVTKGSQERYSWLKSKVGVDRIAGSILLDRVTWVIHRLFPRGFWYVSYVWDLFVKVDYRLVYVF